MAIKKTKINHVYLFTTTINYSTIHTYRNDAAKTEGKKMSYRAYQVTVTPTIVVYCGSWVGGEYTVNVYAKTASAAITEVRRERMDQEGRCAVKAKYRAKILS